MDDMFSVFYATLREVYLEKNCNKQFSEVFVLLVNKALGGGGDLLVSEE